MKKINWSAVFNYLLDASDYLYDSDDAETVDFRKKLAELLDRADPNKFDENGF